jgi:predicted nucleic acid-binding Zn ribbon protein
VSARGEPAKVGALLSDLLEKRGLRTQVRRMEILDLWPDIVGEALAKVTRARGVDGTALLVEVRSSAWLMELDLMKGDFLERVNQRLEDVPFERVVFVLAETE